MTIICLSGLRGTGKDTFGDILVKEYNYKKIALADPLREICSKVFRVPIEDFLDRDKKESEFDRKIFIDYHDLDKLRDIIEFEWGFTVGPEERIEMEECFNTELTSPRDMLRFIGGLLRDNVREDIFIIQSLNKIRELESNVIVTDVRMQNEFDMFKNLNALMVLITRPGIESDGHITEILPDSEGYDVIFDNKEGIQQFRSNIRLWYELRQSTFTAPNRDFKYKY